MVPGRSPVLNTEPHTYMFPDITIDPSLPTSSKPQPQRAFASVGLILNPNISSMELQRFERILKCYTDFHHYTPPKYSEQDSHDVPAPAYVDERRDEGTSAGEASAVEFTDETGAPRAVAVRPRTDVEPADSQVYLFIIFNYLFLLSFIFHFLFVFLLFVTDAWNIKRIKQSVFKIQLIESQRTLPHS